MASESCNIFGRTVQAVSLRVTFLLGSQKDFSLADARTKLAKQTLEEIQETLVSFLAY